MKINNLCPRLCLSSLILWGASILSFQVGCLSEGPLEWEEQQANDWDGDGDGFAVGDDCDDYNPDIYPNASEICNGLDDNCNEQADEEPLPTSEDTLVLTTDADDDGFGESDATPKYSCIEVDGYASVAGDCDDGDADVNPKTREICNGKDDDCDTFVDDEATDGSLMWADNDGDGFGDDAVRAVACSDTVGYSWLRGDCNDSDSNFYPGASDSDGDSMDNDCGGTDGRDPIVGPNEGQFSTIQEAIDAVNPGETASPVYIYVFPDTYSESNITFDGRVVQLRGLADPSRTMVNASDFGEPVFRISSGYGDSGGILIDGFTLTGENTNDGFGGAIWVNDADPIFRDCIIRDSESDQEGGGAYLENSGARFEYCQFVNNQSIRGGGLAIVGFSPVVVFGCQFSDNFALKLASDTTGGQVEGGRGGGIFIDAASPTITHSEFYRNQADLLGGAVGLGTAQAGTTKSRPEESVNTPVTTLLHSLFVENRSGYFGGAVGATNDHRVEIQYSVFHKNIAQFWGGGVYIYSDAVANITASILLDNTTCNVYNEYAAYGSISVDTSYVFGNGTLDDDQSLCYKMTQDEVELVFLAEDNFHLAINSPLIDSGPEDDGDLDGSTSDPGLFGGSYSQTNGQIEESCPLGESFDPNQACPPDLDRDGYPEYPWVGAFADVPESIKVYQLDFDCDDNDPLQRYCN